MKMPSVAELLVEQVKENERRKILELVRDCKSVEDAVDKIQGMISNKN